MDYKTIEEANKQTSTVNIKGKDYVQVNQRVKAFRMVYPNGRITTDIISHQEGMVMMRASIYDDEGGLIATGTAMERQNASQVNRTSYIENCETSAVGRALGFCGFGIDTSIATSEEVENAQLQQENDQKFSVSDRQVALIYKYYSEDEIEGMMKRKNVAAVREFSQEDINTLIAHGMERERQHGKETI